jgi:hypothetical protein
LPADRDALAAQQIAQHPAAGERVVEMQLVDPPHHRQIGRRHRPRAVIKAAAAELQDRRLPGQRKLVLTLDHRFALSMPALPSAPAKIVLQRQLSDLGGVTSHEARIRARRSPNTPAAPPEAATSIA